MFSEDALCSIEKDKFVNALHKFWFMTQWIKLSINLENVKYIYLALGTLYEGTHDQLKEYLQNGTSFVFQY